MTKNISVLKINLEERKCRTYSSFKFSSIAKIVLVPGLNIGNVEGFVELLLNYELP